MSKTNDEIRAALESCLQAMIEPKDASDKAHYRRTIRAMRRAEMRIAELEQALAKESARLRNV